MQESLLDGSLRSDDTSRKQLLKSSIAELLSQHGTLADQHVGKLTQQISLLCLH